MWFLVIARRFGGRRCDLIRGWNGRWSDDSGGCCGRGYGRFKCNWYGGAGVLSRGAYYGNAAWHGGYYGSSGSAYGRYGSAHYGAGYNPSTGTYARGASTSTAYGTQRVGQAYNPSTGAYGATHQGSNANANWGSSTYSKNGQTADTQHYSSAAESFGTARPQTEKVCGSERKRL